MIVKLRCETCGHAVDWNPSKTRERRCKEIKEQARGLNPVRKVYCWGRLVREDKPSKKQMTDLEQAEHCEKQRLIAERKMKRAMTSMNLWSRRRKYYLDKANGRIQREAKPQVEKPKRDRLSREIEI